jgi:hypothetical protein
MGEKRAREALQSLNRAHRIYCDLDARREILDVRRRLERLEASYLQAIELWDEDAPVQPDPPTGPPRGKRVADLAAMLAESVQYGDVVWLRIGAFLHDVGNRLSSRTARQTRASFRRGMETRADAHRDWRLAAAWPRVSG